MTTPPFNLLDTKIGDRVLDGPTIAALLSGVGLGEGASQQFLVNASGVTTLLAAQTVDRIVQITAHVDTATANGDGAQPTFKIGQTGTDNKFIDTSAFTTKSAGTVVTAAGVLSAGDALIVTCTAGTGTTETGAVTFTAVVVPKGS